MAEQKRSRRWDTDASAASDYADHDSLPKKPKIEQHSNGSANGGAALPKLDILQKAKKALELRKQLQEKMKNLPLQVAPKPAAAAPTVQDVGKQIAAGLAATVAAKGGVGSALPASSVPFSKPAPLILDDAGREVDAHGNVVHRKAPPITTLKVNQKADLRNKVEEIPSEEQKPPVPDDAEFFDPAVGNRALKRLQRKHRATFKFVQEGTLQKQAEKDRLRAQFGPDVLRQQAAKRMEAARQTDEPMDVNAIPLGVKAAPEKPPLAPIPDIEWWDARLLANETYDDVLGDNEADPKFKEERITNLVEHPVLIDPPAEPAPPPPQPLKLTAKEQKKLRTQRRQQREQDKQLLIRQGLLEPPKPKVKISNLMRVLGSEATADPTAIEAEVRKQMAERTQAHEDRNLARKLTPAERREKKLRKMFDEDKDATIDVAVYKIRDLSYPQNKFKVDINAAENHLTGVALTTPDMAVVVVEGCSKSHKRYEKLMLRRIDWSLKQDDAPETTEPNYCYLVWKGAVLQRAFDRFRIELCPNELAAKKVLAEVHVAHYWDLAKAYVPPELAN